MCDTLVTKVNPIDTSGFILKTKCNFDNSGPEKEVSDSNGVVGNKKQNPMQKNKFWQKYQTLTEVLTNLNIINFFGEILFAKIKEKELVDKSNISGFI